MTSLNETSSIATFEPLSTASQRTGAIIVAVFALLSTLALAFIALRAIRFAIVALLRRDDSTFQPPEILFFRTQLGHYGGCLILSNLFISLAALLGFDWTSHFGLNQGSACSVQAALMQIGIWGTCYFTTALGVHTLGSFVFRLRQARWRSLTTATIGWTIALVAGLAPLHISGVYGPVGPSCGITPSHPKDILTLEALPIIFAAFTSAVVYSIIFIALHGKLSVNGMRKLRGRNFDHGEEEEYHGFISTIIWTMFWFPIAFVFLLLPFCITRIVLYARHSVPFASSVFADVCASMLGIVHVGLLYNTFRVISPAYRGSCSDKSVTETVMTFGNDASGESPIAPSSKSSSHSVIWSHENGFRLHKPAQPWSNHSRDSSWASVGSSMELLRAKNTTYEPVQMKIVSPSALSRQFSGDAPLSTTIDSSRHRVPSLGRDTRPEPPAKVQQHPFRQTPDTNAARNGVKVPAFKSKAPPALNLSHPPDLPNPFLPLEITNKSSTLAARLGVSAASVGVLSPTSAQKLEQGKKSVPRIGVNKRHAERANESNRRPSHPSSSSSDGDSGYYVGEVWQLPPIPEASENGESIGNAPSLRTLPTLSRRTSMTTVWSQDTGYTLTRPDPATLQLYPHPVAHLLIPWRDTRR